MTQDFLSRWSRRKQAAARAAESARPAPNPERAAAQEHAANFADPELRDTSAASASAPEPGAPSFDPASLPAIESITAQTDIRAFFAAGVPADLTRAALRRAWTSDPAIRDFVGLADYDWDFNTPGSMAGFGPLEGADALRAQFARRLGAATAGDSVAEPSQQDLGAQDDGAQDDGAQDDGSVPEDSDRGRPDQPTQIVTVDEPSRKIDAAPAHDELIRPDHDHAAVQQQEKSEEAQSITHRRHGGALPQA
jgi:Protein of unknown function (DUF3306)